MNSDIGDRRTPAQLFTLRVWSEEVGAAQTEWRGRAQHVATGETRYFRTWETLVMSATVIAMALLVLGVILK
jgi:hypothetical protein